MVKYCFVFTLLLSSRSPALVGIRCLLSIRRRRTIPHIIDYRTLRHRGTHIVFLDYEGELNAVVFSSFGATLKFLKYMRGYEATVHDEHGDIIAFTTKGGITLCQP